MIDTIKFTFADETTISKIDITTKKGGLNKNVVFDQISECCKTIKKRTKTIDFLIEQGWESDE